MSNKAIIVLDIGKTMSKLSLWSFTGELLARKTRPNNFCKKPLYSVLDVEGIEAWVVETLNSFARLAEIGSIIPVAHGAALAAVRDGKCVVSPMDYESTPSATIRKAYEEARGAFSETGSPLLSETLNAALQLFWMEELDSSVFEGATLMPWAQYWAWFLSGQARSEITSLGCHTDLWSYKKADFSLMAKARGWDKKFAPLAHAGNEIGAIKLDLARKTGLPVTTRIHCGIHDSNAALVAARAFPLMKNQDATILSTGTWFIGMRTVEENSPTLELPEGKDCLLNIDAWGRFVPSSRFMGGREIESIIKIDARRIDIEDDQDDLLRAVPEVVRSLAMLTPTFANGFGPYPDMRGRWWNMPDDWSLRRSATCLYAALVSNTSLDLIGAKNVIVIEGRFARAQVFIRALAALRPNDKIFTSHAEHDVSFGALLLINPELKPDKGLTLVEPLDMDLLAYQKVWERLTQSCAG